MAVDKYAYQDDASSPARKPYEVTPNDAVPLDPVPKALYVGTGGTIKLSGVGGANCTFTNVANGTMLPVRAEYVYSTGTTANNIVALV